jgi:putative transposase
LQGFVYVAFVLDALEQAIHQRRPAQDQLVHHSDRGSQYLSIKYTERLAEAKIIHRRGPWRSFEAVEYATLE